MYFICNSEKDKYSKLLGKYFNKLTNKSDSFSLLNTSFSKEGAYVHIPKNIELAKPIEIVHINTGSDNSLMLQPRNLIIVEKSSKVEIIESHYSIEKNGALT